MNKSARSFPVSKKKEYGPNFSYYDRSPFENRPVKLIPGFFILLTGWNRRADDRFNRILNELAMIEIELELHLK